MPEPRVIRVNTPSRSYDVRIGAGALTELGARTRGALGDEAQRALLVHDEGVPAALVDSAAESLQNAGFETARAGMRAAEQHKTLATAERLLADCALARVERGDCVVALGGGVVGDTAGFVAATWRRGVAFVQCPTTLLSMVDASVGGKTGVNLVVPDAAAPRLLKNMVGAFWQPRLVIADIAALGSLDERDFRAGLFECVKHGMIARSVGAEAPGAPALLGWTCEHMPAIHERDEAALTELVARNVALKARVVEGDEREEAPDAAGGRALLNLGHTFAHAIETLPGLSPDGDPRHAPLLHGEAVGFGLIAAAATARAMGLLHGSDDAIIRAAVAECGLPSATLRGLPPDDALLESMRHDKKNRAGRMRLILPCGPGEAQVVSDPPMPLVRAGLAAIRG